MQIQELQQIAFDEAQATLWFFKKPQKDANGVPKYLGRWLNIDDSIEEKLISAAIETVGRVHEIVEFSLLAATNDGRALSINTDETHAPLIESQISAEVPDKQISKVNEVFNSLAYVAKFIVKGERVLACKKLDSSWSTKKSNSLIPAAFQDATLTLAPENTFQMPKDFDFFVIGRKIVITSKNAFESVLFYKAAHQQDFTELLAEKEFSDCFSTIAPLQSFVGENKLHLRRACAIRQKRHYKDPQFMNNLRARYSEFKLNINFDAAGKIIPCEDTCRDIFSALLDHRLKSGFSNSIYDVPDGSVV